MRVLQSIKSSFILTSIFVMMSFFAFSQNTIIGKVIDKQNNPLAGASIIIKGTTIGTSSDADGNFKLSSSKALPFTIVVSFTGYSSTNVVVKENNVSLSITLEEDESKLDEIVVSASRKAEKIQEAPSAMSVISSKKIMLDNVANPFLNLRNVTGVDVAQTGVSDGQINLRGRSAAFNTETFVIADYRNIVLPSFGVMFYGQNPIDAIDMDRIEVVKGPGGALYGPGVEAGVVHFISKSAFKEKGTTISLGAGNRNQLQGAFRTAMVNKSGKLGFKLTGYYRTAKDFEVDMTDPAVAARVNAYPKEIKSSLTGEKIKDGGLDYENKAYNVNASLEYRFTPSSSIIGVVGTGHSQGLFKTGQSDGYISVSRPYAQIRYQNKGFFAQTFWSHQQGTDGTAWVYATGGTQINDIKQFEGQAQYNFLTVKNKLDVTIGGDYRLNKVDTKGTVNGRFELDDDYMITGAYIQAKLALAQKLDMIGAARYDYFGALKQTGFSPRLGFVFKANNKNTFRLTWNRALGAPSSLQLVNDFAAANRGAFLVWLNAGSQPLTYNNNRYYSFVTQQTSTSPNLPLAVAYAAATAGLQAANAPLPFNLLNSAAFKALITGTTAGSMIDASGNPYSPLVRNPIGISTSDMIELGYTGKINKLNVTVDLYHNIRKNNLTPALTASPLIGYANAGADLKKVVYDALIASNIPAANATAIAAAYEAAINTNAKTKTGAIAPLGLLSSDQSPTGKTLDLTYYNIEKISYTGADLGLSYEINNKLSVFTNYTYLSKVYWDKVKVTGTSTTVPFSLNQPNQRFRIGFDYVQQKGIIFNAAMRYQSGFESVNGLAWSGTLPAFTVFDAGVGYGFGKGLMLNVSGTNLFNEKYRVLVNAPIISRLILAKLTYKFGSK